MLKAKDLAAKALMSVDEHKRSATTLRRLSGGIGAQRSNALELSGSEKAILTEAEHLLDRMAEVAAQAAKLRKKAEEIATARRDAIKAATESTFGRLSTVADKVALIGAVQSYSLKANAEAWATSQHMLAEVFRDAMDDLTWKLARSEPNKPVSDLVADAWTRFQQGRAAIEDQHARLIVSQQRLHGEYPSSK